MTRRMAQQAPSSALWSTSWEHSLRAETRVFPKSGVEMIKTRKTIRNSDSRLENKRPIYLFAQLAHFDIHKLICFDFFKQLVYVWYAFGIFSLPLLSPPLLSPMVVHGRAQAIQQAISAALMYSERHK